MDQAGYILLKKSDRRTGSICLKVSGEQNEAAVEAGILEIAYLLRYEYPFELTNALACNLHYLKEWYRMQKKDGLLIPTRPRLILPEVIEGFKQERYFKV